MTHPVSRTAHAQDGLGLATLAVAGILGGGQGTLGDTAAQLLALALLAVLAWQARSPESEPVPAWTWLPVAVVVAIPLLQLLPIPGGLWHLPAARGEILAQLQAAGVAPPSRWSLDPVATERSLAWLLPGIALYLSMLRTPRARQAPLWTALFVLAGVDAALGLAQMAGGPDSPLRFYSNTNETAAVGLFANANHLACLLALALPLAIARLAVPGRPVLDRGLGVLRLVAFASLLLLLLAGLALTRSRSGLVLGMLAIVAVVPMLWVLGRGRRGVRRGAAVLLIAGSLLVAQFALGAAWRQFAVDPLGGDRVAMAHNTLAAASAHAPLGSGLGTFRHAYAPFDFVRPRVDPSTIVNHAHDDYLELWLEAGWLAPPAIALFLGFCAFAAWRTWRNAAHPGERLVAVALAAALAVPLLHSLVDYPLRTSANIAVFGLLLGIVVARAGASPSSTGMRYTSA